MTRKFIGVPIYTAENTDPPTINQKFSVGENFILKAIRAWILIYNNPAFTSLTMHLYASRGGVAVKKIASSTTTWTKAQVTTLDNAHKELYFTFPEVVLRADTDYHCGVVLSGYTGDGTSHVAMASSFPDPIYRTGLTISITKGGLMPLGISLIGSSLP